MKKQILGIVLVFLCAATVSGSGDFWKQKESEDWSPDEIIQMLNKSPWARGVEVSLGGIRFRHGPGGFGGGGSGGGPDGMGRFPGGARGQRRPRRARPPLKLIIRWYSALPIKQALTKAKSGPEATALPPEFLKHDDSHFVVGVSGFPARMFRFRSDRPRGGSEHLLSESLLKVRDQAPISARLIKISKDRALELDARTGQAGVELFVHFPRPEEPAIDPENRDIEFVMKLGNLSIKRKFKLKDMIYKGQLEL